MTTEATLVDLFKDIKIDDSEYEFIMHDMTEQEAYERLLKTNPNSIVLYKTFRWANSIDNDSDSDSDSHRALINMLKLMLIEFVRDPYWNSRLGWLMWFWVCYARYDSYYPMKWCYHYDPLNWYRPGEPQRPPELERTMPDDPFNIKGECFVHPEWYKQRALDIEKQALSGDTDATGDIQE